MTILWEWWLVADDGGSRKSKVFINYQDGAATIVALCDCCLFALCLYRLPESQWLTDSPGRPPKVHPQNLSSLNLSGAFGRPWELGTRRWAESSKPFRLHIIGSLRSLIYKLSPKLSYGYDYNIAAYIMIRTLRFGILAGLKSRVQRNGCDLLKSAPSRPLPIQLLFSQILHSSGETLFTLFFTIVWTLRILNAVFLFGVLYNNKDLLI